MTKKQLIKFFEDNDFRVHLFEEEGKQIAEIERWTDGGVDMIILLRPFTFEEFKKYVNDFSVDDEIMLHRQAKDYCTAFTIRESLEDFENYHQLLKDIVKKIDK